MCDIGEAVGSARVVVSSGGGIDAVAGIEITESLQGIIMGITHCVYFRALKVAGLLTTSVMSAREALSLGILQLMFVGAGGFVGYQQHDIPRS